jgi:hypothetical protein
MSSLDIASSPFDIMFKHPKGPSQRLDQLSIMEEQHDASSHRYVVIVGISSLGEKSCLPYLPHSQKEQQSLTLTSIKLS